jgi:hypothetical protein
MRNTLALALMIVLMGCASAQREAVVEAKGEFATIDTSTSRETIRAIKVNDATAIEGVISSPGSYSPPVLYALSSALFESGKKDEAAFWFYAGQLRARSDANKSLDPSAKQAVAVLNQKYGERINRHAFGVIENLRITVEQVIAWDEKTERKYDPRWIALHGMDAYTESTIRFVPQQDWEKIDAKTREEYLQGFRQAMEMLKRQG